MPASFPTSLDTFTNPSATNTLNSPSHSAIETAQNTSIAAVEVKLGINNSSDVSSIDYLLKNSSSIDPGHKHTTGSISGQIAVPQGGTGQSTFTKGDLLVGNGSNALDKLGVGADGQVLTADSTQTDGVKWGTIAAYQSTQNYQANVSITAGQPVYVLLGQADGGLMLDNSVIQNSLSNSTSFSFTVGNNANRVLVAFVSSLSSGTPTITYNGVSMTGIDTGVQAGSGTGIWQSSFYLVAPATGSNTVAVTATADYNVILYSLYNAKQSGQPDAHASTQGTSSSSSFSHALTTVADGSWVIGCLYTALSGATLSSQTNFTTNTLSGNTGGGTGTTIASMASSPTHPAGSVTQSANISGTGSFVFLQVSIAPASGYTTAQVAPTSASSTSTSNGFIGFAQTSASALGTVSVAVGGRALNQSGLTVGTQYYLGNSTGTISSSAGANTRKVGIADSTTSIIITNIW